MGELICIFMKSFFPTKVKGGISLAPQQLVFLETGILFPKFFWPTVRKKCSSGWEKLLEFEAGGREFAKFLKSVEQFIQTVKGQNNFC